VRRLRRPWAPRSRDNSTHARCRSPRSSLRRCRCRAEPYSAGTCTACSGPCHSRRREGAGQRFNRAAGAAPKMRSACAPRGKACLEVCLRLLAAAAAARLASAGQPREKRHPSQANVVHTGRRSSLLPAIRTPRRIGPPEPSRQSGHAPAVRAHGAVLEWLADRRARNVWSKRGRRRRRWRGQVLAEELPSRVLREGEETRVPLLFPATLLKMPFRKHSSQLFLPFRR
jgi:hypothetical protein